MNRGRTLNLNASAPLAPLENRRAAGACRYRAASKPESYLITYYVDLKSESRSELDNNLCEFLMILSNPRIIQLRA